MLKRRTSDFAMLVFEAASRLGNSATRIADEIIEVAFPRTVEESQHEGAYKLLRKGVITEVKRTLNHVPHEGGQLDFLADIDPVFTEIVGKLKRSKYFVEAVDEYVPIEQLVKDPELLDDARKLMRRKGNECLAEAGILDELYEAVTSTEHAA